MSEPIDAQHSQADRPDTPIEPRPFQFTLRQLMLWVAMFAIVCGLLAWLRNGIRDAQDAARRAACMDRTKQLGLALLNYHHAHGHFPPAYICDDNGKPMHSWRVLILPFMEQQALYDQYDFSEPWNGPNNSKLTVGPAIRGATWFQCPGGDLAGTPLTNYVAIVGPQTMWPEDECMRLTGEPGSGLDTIHVIEITNSDIHWMEPRDLTFEQATAGIQPESGLGISSEHLRGIVYLNANYEVHVLDRDVDADELRKLLSVPQNAPTLERTGRTVDPTQQFQD